MKKTFPLRWHSEQLFLSWRTPSRDFRYFQNAIKELKGLLYRNSWLLQWFKRIYWIFLTVIEQCDVIVFWVRVKNKNKFFTAKGRLIKIRKRIIYLWALSEETASKITSDHKDGPETICENVGLQWRQK